MRAIARLLPAIAVFTPFAASQETALPLLQKVAATYTALRTGSYDFEQVEIRESLGRFRNRTQDRHRLVGSGGRYRDEFLPSGPVYLFDGEVRWSYNPERREYTKAPGRGGLAPGLGMLAVAPYRVKSARNLRLETVELATGPVMCQVIEVERENSPESVQYSPMTYWIDTARNLVLKQQYNISVAQPGGGPPSESSITVTFSKASIHGPVQEALLHFTPPADGVLVDKLTFTPKSALTGKDSPNFEWKGADGKLISSGSFRGRPVLLQFGASSDDDALLFSEMLHRALRGNGLTAFYVVNGRDYGKPAATYTIPTIIDADGSVARSFGVQRGGLVLLDRAGKIAYIDYSLRNSTDLVRALQAAGAW